MSGKLLHICLISVHGLIRADDPELGRDADTGGQVLYVLELAKALAAAQGVGRVDLVTRKINCQSLDSIYAQPIEAIATNANIVRIAAGGHEYLRKEDLWLHLDSFSTNLEHFYTQEQTQPDVIHAHYADSGYVGQQLASVFKVPLLFTSHSLGRDKRRRLLAIGLGEQLLEQRYSMSCRIAAEEKTLANAAGIIASTKQEIEQQYKAYQCYRPETMRVIAPGTCLERFYPPRGDERYSAISTTLQRFLNKPEKPFILAISRADARKNITALIHAYGQDKALQRQANLVLILGNRERLSRLESGALDVMTEVLDLIDDYDLYGKVAYPKHHRADDVPVLFRLAAESKGVFVNPALTEPFGLTLLESAASGLPVVATNDGGPVDIIGNCQNGLLIDPLNVGAIADAIRAIVCDPESWESKSRAGLQQVRQHYSWDVHAAGYLEMVFQILGVDEPRVIKPHSVKSATI